MYDTLKWFGALRCVWCVCIGGGGGGGEWVRMWKIVRTFGKNLAMSLLVNIAIQMVCPWPVGILNLVGHNEKHRPVYHIKSPFLHFIFIFFTITHSPLNHAVQIHVPFTACEVIWSVQNSWTTFLSLLVVNSCPPLCHSVQFTSSLSSHC